jgi:hypothetical protein
VTLADWLHTRLLYSIVEWYGKSLEKLVSVFNLTYTASRGLLAFDFGVTLFCSAWMVGFFLHDILDLLHSWFRGGEPHFFAFKCFVCSLVVLVISIAAIFGLEYGIMRRS